MAETYWSRRQARADERLARMESTVEGRVREAYGRELRALEREIAELYERFGTDGVLRYRDMLRAMDPADRRLLIEDCEAFARQHPELADMVEVRKGIWQLDRMEGLRTSARLHMARATADATEGLDDHFAEVAAVESNAVAEAMGYGRAFHTLDDAAMRLLVGTEWSDGLSYSESIWGSARKVAEYVNRDMTQALIRGDSYQRICRDMAKRFEGQSVSNVMRVVQTEGTHVARQAQASEMRAEGFEEYCLDPVGDDRTCDRCREAARESRRRPFRFDEAETGANFPPLHPRCRCMVNPAVEDWSAWLRKRREERREAPDGTGDEAIAKRFGGRSVGAALPSENPSSNVIMTKRQFGKKLTKHAKDWGLNPAAQGDREEFEHIIEGIIDGADDVSRGEWRGQPGPCRFYRRGEDLVIVNANDEFVTVMRGGASNVRYQRAIGRLGD